MVLFLVTLLGFLKDGKKRYDGSPSLPYYSSTDLGIKEQRFRFYSGKNLLFGSRYYCGDGPYKAVVIFFHGIGAGRTAYLKLISVLAKEGYLVYAYDNTGCMESEGEGYVGLGHCNYDQTAFFRFLDSDPTARGYKRYAIGHSWGGYSSLTSLREGFGVSKCVSISGFLSPEREILSIVKNLKSGFMKQIGRLCIKICFHNEMNLDARKVIEKSKAKVLYIQGTEDHMVPFHTAGETLKKEMGANSHIEYMFLQKRGHSPYLTVEAESYINHFFETSKKTISAEKNPSLDIEKACELNPLVMERIIDFFNQ